MNIMRKTSQSYTKRKLPVILGVLTLMALGIGWYLFIYDPPYSGTIGRSERPLVFAHRGYGDLGPDNSLSAAQAAIKDGLDGVDVDGQLTSDGQIVVFHDLSIDRLTNSTGRVSAHSLPDLRKLDLGTKFGDPRFQASYVSSFEDFVKAIPPKGILMVELKVAGIGKTGIEEKAAHIIKKHHAEDRVYLSSFNPVVLYRLKQIDKRIKTVFIFMDTNWNPQLLAEIKPSDKIDLPWIVRQEWIRRAIRKVIAPDMLSVNLAVSEKTRRNLLENGWPIFLWTPNDPTAINQALSQQPHGVISDQPLLEKQLRDKMYP